MIKIMNHELAKTLTTALVQFIDREQPKDKMCVSSIEAEELERCFTEEKFKGVEDWCAHRMKPELTEFEEELVNFYNKRSMLPQDKNGTYNRHDCEELLHESAKKLLELTKKELARRDEVITLNNLSPYDKGFQDGKVEAMADLERTFKCNPDKLPGWLKDELNKAFKKGQEASHEDYIKGYANGYKDAKKRHNESVAYHSPSMPVTPSGYGCDGTYCINLKMDCINCPRRTDGGILNTQSGGTSTAKEEG